MWRHLFASWRNLPHTSSLLRAPQPFFNGEENNTCSVVGVSVCSTQADEVNTPCAQCTGSHHQHRSVLHSTTLRFTTSKPCASGMPAYHHTIESDAPEPPKKAAHTTPPSHMPNDHTLRVSVSLTHSFFASHTQPNPAEV